LNQCNENLFLSLTRIFTTILKRNLHSRIRNIFAITSKSSHLLALMMNVIIKYDMTMLSKNGKIQRNKRKIKKKE